MNSRRELLALRREVLVARSSLQRLKIGRDAGALRESLRLPSALRTAAGSPAGRSVLFGLLLLAAGSGRLARMLRVAATTLAVAKLGVALLLAGKGAQDARSEPTSAASSHSSEAAS